MVNQIVKWSGGQIVVRPGLVEDEITASAIAGPLMNAYPDGTFGTWVPFVEMCCQTVSSEGLEFKPEHVRNMDPAQIKDAYECFLKLPKGIRKKWKEAYELVDAGYDVELGPEPLPETASKKA